MLIDKFQGPWEWLGAQIYSDLQARTWKSPGASVPSSLLLSCQVQLIHLLQSSSSAQSSPPTSTTSARGHRSAPRAGQGTVISSSWAWDRATVCSALTPPPLKSSGSPHLHDGSPKLWPLTYHHDLSHICPPFIL